MAQLLFEYYGDTQRESLFPPNYYKNVNNYAFEYLTIALFSCTYVQLNI